MWWLLRVVAVITLVAVGKGLLSSCGFSNLVLSSMLLSSFTGANSLVEVGVQVSSCGVGLLSSCIG